MSSYLGDKLISGAEQFVGESRNIGQIIPATIPLTDAGLHLLDGSLILGGGIYNAFVDYIAGLVTDYPDLFETEANWQSAVLTYGVCGKFVYDSVNNTVRLPKITGILEGTTDITALGDLVEAGLPNITGSINSTVNWSPVSATGAIQGTALANQGAAGNAGTTFAKYTLDASRSSSIYGNSSTVQPQTIKCYYYIVIATSTKTDIEVDIDEVVTDLNGKADTDFSNVTDAANVIMAKASMPSGTYINLTLGASGTSYIAPADGWIVLSLHSTANSYSYLNNSTSGILVGGFVSAGITEQRTVPVKKNDLITVAYGSIDNQDKLFKFIYAVGSEV